MNFTIHWDVPRSGHAAKDEKTKPFKHRLGCQPNSSTQKVSFKMPSKINRKWKDILASKVHQQFRRNRKPIIFVDGTRFEVSCNDGRSFANRMGNLLLEHFNKHQETMTSIMERTGSDIAGSIANAQAR